MNRCSRILLGWAIVLVLALGAVAVDGTRPRDRRDERELARLTGLPGPALAVSYLEPRCDRVLDDASGVQPGLPAPRTMDFSHGR